MAGDVVTYRATARLVLDRQNGPTLVVQRPRGRRALRLAGVHLDWSVPRVPDLTRRGRSLTPFLDSARPLADRPLARLFALGQLARPRLVRQHRLHLGALARLGRRSRRRDQQRRVGVCVDVGRARLGVQGGRLECERRAARELLERQERLGLGGCARVVLVSCVPQLADEYWRYLQSNRMPTLNA